jgi:hypothetical protein
MAIIEVRPSQRQVQTGRSLAQLPVQGVPGAIEAAGSTMAAASRVSNAVTQFAEKLQEGDDNLALSNARVGAMDAISQAQIDAGQGNDYATAPDRFRAAAMEALTRQAQELSPRIRDRFIADMQGVVASRIPNVRQEAYQQQSQAIVASTGETLRALGHQTASAANPAEREILMGQAESTIRDLVTNGRITESGAARLRQGFRSDVAKAEVGALMSRSPGEALRQLNAGRWNDAMDVDTIQGMRDRAETALMRAEARADAARQRQERAVAVELQQVNSLLSNGIVPADRMDRIRTMARGTIYEGQIDGLVSTARDVGRFAALPAPRQAEMLQQYEARMRGGNATDADLSTYNHLRQAAAAQQRDLNTQGLARAVTDGVVEALPAFDASNPAVVRQYEAAAQAATSHYGRPVSMLTEQGARALAERFQQANPEQAMGMLMGLVNGLQDDQVRTATLQHLERTRGDGGRLTPGTLTRLASLARSGFDGQQQAIRLLSSLRADVSDRARQEGEAPAFRQAVTNIASSGPLRVLTRQAEVTGDPRYAAVVSRDLDIIRRDAQVRMTAGETSPERAVQAAAAALASDRQVLDDSNLAAVYFPRNTSATEVRSGLTTLRDRTVTESAAPAGPQESQQAVTARARQEAARRAIWVNEGSRFALVAPGQSGVPVVLREATLEQVLLAGRETVQQQASQPPATAVDRRLQQENQRSRRIPAARQRAPELD